MSDSFAGMTGTRGTRPRASFGKARVAIVFAAVALAIATTAAPAMASGSTSVGTAALAHASTAAVTTGTAGTASTGAPAAGRTVDAATRSGTVSLSGSPGVPVADSGTGTVYVPIQCAKASCASGGGTGHVVDVISSARCSAAATSRCRVAGTVQVGNGPRAGVIDDRTHTLYTANSSGTVSVVDIARCNAHVTSGCGRARTTVSVGGFPVADAFDPATRTLYVASSSGKVFVIDTASCNAVTTTGCRQRVRSVTDGARPSSIGVDAATDTVYAANAGATGTTGHTVSVINGSTCNGTRGSGCGKPPRTIKVGSDPQWLTVDQANDTVYVANHKDGTVSIVNGAACNARVTAGCSRLAPAVATGLGTTGLEVDSSVHTLFALNQSDDTLSAINTETCKGATASKCLRHPRDEQAAPAQGAAYISYPNQVAILGGTAYLVHDGGFNILSAVSIRGCSSTSAAACRVEAPTVPNPEYSVSVDAATDTIYATDRIRPEIDVLNGATCDAANRSACTPVAEIPLRHSYDLLGAVDVATGTLYVSDHKSDTVLVVDTAVCNAEVTTGCAVGLSKLTVGPGPGIPVVDDATDTLYVAHSSSNALPGNRIAVVDTATCSAEDVAGCGQVPAQVKVANGTGSVAVSVATDTVYAPSQKAGTVAVVNGATCRAADVAGCGVAATVKVGADPFAVAVDDPTHTAYVSNSLDGIGPGTLSVLDTATCNGSDTAGCKGPVRTVAVADKPLSVIIDTQTDTVFAADYASAAVSVLNGATCNAAVLTGCGVVAPTQAVASEPVGLAVNPVTGSVYVTNTGSVSISIFKA